jgi:CHAT domain-containing protein
MKYFCVVLLLLLTSGFVYAQQPATWHSVADKYLTTLVNGEDLAFETPDNLEALRLALATEYKKGNLDPALMHWLAVWSANQNDPNAQKYFQEALKFYTNNSYQRALFLMDYYRLSFQHGETNLELIKSALSAFKEARKDSSRIYLCALTDYATALIKSKNYVEGLQHLKKARILAEATEGTKTEIYSTILKSFGDYYNTVGNLEDAVKYTEMADKIVANHLGVNELYRIVFGDPLPYVTSTPVNSSLRSAWRIAALYQHSPDEVYNSELFIYQKALAAERYEEIVKGFDSPLQGEEQSHVAVLFNKGVLDLSINNEAASKSLAKALPYYRKLALEKKDITTFFNCANYLSIAYVQEKNYVAALNIAYEVEKLLVTMRLKGYKWYDKIHHNIILIYALGNDRANVLSLLEPYYGTKPYYIDYDFKERYTKYGDILFDYADYKKALTLYTRAHTEYWSEAEKNFSPKEKITDGEGNEIETLSYDNIVLDISATDAVSAIHKFKPSSDNYMRLVYKLGQTALLCGKYADARKYVLEYINEFYTRIENGHIISERGTDLYEIYRLKHELFPAYNLYQNIIMRDTTTAKDVIADNNARGYMHILDSKANIQYEYRHMRNVIENGNDEQLKQTFQTYNSQRHKLAQLRLAGNGDQQEMENLSISIDTLKSYMSAKTASGIFDLPSKKFIYWTDVKKSLKRNEAAVEIRRFPKYDSGGFTNEIIYAVYVITPLMSSPKVAFIKNGNHLEGRGLKLYQNSIKLKQEDKISYAEYWNPIQQLLTGISKVYLSSDGVYTQLNVNTLLNPISNKYLIEELKVYNVISTKAISTITNFPLSVKEATLMGRPAYYLNDLKELKDKNSFNEEEPHRAITREQIASDDIIDLPGTEKEVEDIAKILKSKGVRTKYFIGRNSTEEEFKKSSGDILHIATHGFWFKENNIPDTDAMLNSGLLLAGVKSYYEQKNTVQREDGILTAYEVQGMNLMNTQLVVLSACETAVGHVEAGEGVYGLQRAFNIAGADKLIMSLWKVDDTATQELFTSFYQNWIKGSSGILSAFQQAQNDIRKKYKHPYYWGAFVLVD